MAHCIPPIHNDDGAGAYLLTSTAPKHTPIIRRQNHINSEENDQTQIQRHALLFNQIILLIFHFNDLPLLALSFFLLTSFLPSQTI